MCTHTHIYIYIECALYEKHNVHSSQRTRYCGLLEVSPHPEGLCTYLANMRCMHMCSGLKILNELLGAFCVRRTGTCTLGVIVLGGSGFLVRILVLI